MILVVQVGQLYEISFRYDPVLVSLIKNVPSKKWDSSRKVWTIHKDHLGWFLKEIEDTPYKQMVKIQSQEHLNENAAIDTHTKIPEVDISDVNFRVAEGFKPYQHQLDFMKYALDRQNKGYWGGFILGDEQGLAKTMETVNLAIYNRAHGNCRRCLIICCINSSKSNWKNDIFKHTCKEYDAYILGSRYITRGRRKGSIRFESSTEEKYNDLADNCMYGDPSSGPLPFFLVLNIEALRYKVGRKYPITQRIIDMVKSGEIDMIAIDEVHKNMSPTSTQGKQILKIKEAVGTKCMWMPITGTLIVNRPTDAFTPLKLIDAHSFPHYGAWCKHFCLYGGYGGHEIVGYRNIPELKTMIDANMIRRLKKDVLDLPPKIHILDVIENTAYQERLYAQVQNEIASDTVANQQALNPLTRFLRLRQVNGAPELVDPSLKIDDSYIQKNARLAHTLSRLEEIHDRGEKVLIFSNWVEPLRTLYRFVSKKYKVCCYTGTMREDVREKHKRVFMTNPAYTIMLGTIGAMGTTHTLTAANNVIFYDEPWTPSDKEQAADRTHRISQVHDSVNVYTIISRDTVDDRVHSILYQKEGVSGYIVDDRLDLQKHPELFHYLLQGKLPQANQ